MLVLSRHRDESIIIDDVVVVTVVDIRGDKVRLGIAAPIEIPVHREEVWQQIHRQTPPKPREPADRPALSDVTITVAEYVRLAQAAADGELLRRAIRGCEQIGGLNLRQMVTEFAAAVRVFEKAAAESQPLGDAP